jgi:hypothetical protein
VAAGWSSLRVLRPVTSRSNSLQVAGLETSGLRIEKIARSRGQAIPPLGVAGVWSARRETGRRTALEHHNSPWRTLRAWRAWASHYAQCTRRRRMFTLVMLASCVSRGPQRLTLLAIALCPPFRRTPERRIASSAEYFREHGRHTVHAGLLHRDVMHLVVRWETRRVPLVYAGV